jgi:hypothetical protein
VGIRRATAALLIVIAVLLSATTLFAGRAGAGVTTPFSARFDVNTNGAIMLRGNSNVTCLLTGQATCPQARNGRGRRGAVLAGRPPAVGCPPGRMIQGSEPASSARWRSELVKCSWSKGGKWMISRTDCGTADQS